MGHSIIDQPISKHWYSNSCSSIYHIHCNGLKRLKGALYRIYQVRILCRRFPAKFSAIVRPGASHARQRPQARPSARVADCLTDTSRWLVKGIVQILAIIANAETCAIECRRGVHARVRSEAVFARNAANVARQNSIVLMSWAGQGRSSLNSLGSSVLIIFCLYWPH